MVMFADSLDVLTFPTFRDHGRDRPDFDATPSVKTVRGVDAQPGASTELVAQRQESTAVRWSVFVPVRALRKSGATLDEGSLVRLRGVVYEVDGRPLEWVNGSRLDHYVLALVTWEPK